jgi:hypothetical protein
MHRYVAGCPFQTHSLQGEVCGFLPAFPASVVPLICSSSSGIDESVPFYWSNTSGSGWLYHSTLKWPKSNFYHRTLRPHLKSTPNSYSLSWGTPRTTSHRSSIHSPNSTKTFRLLFYNLSTHVQSLLKKIKWSGEWIFIVFVILRCLEALGVC